MPASLLGPHLSTLSSSAVYLIVFTFVLFESGIPLGLLLPGDTLLFGAGLLAAVSSSGVSLVLLIVVACVAAVLGDAVGYELGRRAGRPWLERRKDGRINARHLARAEEFAARYGWFAMVAARFVPYVRGFAPILAGIARMRYTVFTSANVVGALAWGLGFVLLGYYAYQIRWLRDVTISVTVAVVVGVFAFALGRYATRRRRARSRRGSDSG